MARAFASSFCASVSFFEDPLLGFFFFQGGILDDVAMKLPTSLEIKCSAPSYSGRAILEDKIGGANHAQARPEKIERQWLAHIPYGKARKNNHSNDFLHDFKLAQRELSVPVSVRGNLQDIFEKGDAPACEYRDKKRFIIEIFQVPVPGKSHENIRADKKENGVHGAAPFQTSLKLPAVIVSEK